ncbi:hypothetical protein NDU88_000148 [Pleurodeles waltl]|uniref:Uncharacterized protein n=1 Tax=Pleurodeles waltl TaxID=8319 RepID=A0AAV7TGB8_PLEWA|nr:hypothetical protein NDU88_000148 [Pleurodeles waltl]
MERAARVRQRQPLGPSAGVWTPRVPGEGWGPWRVSAPMGVAQLESVRRTRSWSPGPDLSGKCRARVGRWRTKFDPPALTGVA